MARTRPAVYVLHGEDEFSIAQVLSELEARLGDASLVAMNTTRLDGRTANLDDLPAVAFAAPFLAERRLVILENPTARLTSQSAQKKFTDFLDKVPSSTALVLIEHHLLTEERERMKGKVHWLERWAEQAGERAYRHAYPLPKGEKLVRKIQDQAKDAGGQIDSQAAGLLASLVGDDPRLADQEVRKLLAYVNYSRTVQADDVEALTADVWQGDIFVLVDALGNQDGRKASAMLQRLLETQDAPSIFGMVIRQFRLLLLARDALDRGGREQDVIRELTTIRDIHPYSAKKVIGPARRFTLPLLEDIYSRLLAMDEAIKTSQVEGELALDTLVAAFAES
jgi:DNA polymerase-3 subunit delta